MLRPLTLGKRTFVLAAALLGALSWGGLRAQEAPQGVEAQVAAAADEAEKADPAEIFAASRKLEKLGRETVAAAKRKLETASPRGTLLLARLLIVQKEKAAAIAALEKTAQGDDDVAALLAVEMIQQAATSRDDVKACRALLEKLEDPRRKIAVAKLLRAKAQDTDAERLLKEYLRAEEPTLRAEAAFALADLGNTSAARPVLDELASEPTERGKRAKAILDKEKLLDQLRGGNGLDASGQAKLSEGKIKELEGKLAELKKRLEQQNTGAGAGVDSPLLEEILRDIKLYYVDEGEKIDNKQLIDAAAKGMVSSLDPFSSYMTEKETADFDQGMAGKYAGIGAVVSMDPKDKLLTIIRPIYSGPAYKAGLRSMDKITEVEGESTFGKTVEELVLKLKGLPDTKVKIKVYRKGWTKEQEFTLDRREIQLKSVHAAMLPGKVGYLSLTQFGQQAVTEVEQALVNLEKDGMRALIFDLRANPGGLLSAAVEISDKFLKDNKLIVYSKGRNEVIAPYREFRTEDAATHPDYPMVVIVNHGSASASEIVSGALQDHKRATLVGENTFGKGSVQQLMKLKSTNEKATLRLTIAKYYLPSGRSIHRDEKTGKGGVDPDIVVENETDPTWAIQEADKLVERQAIEKFVNTLWPAEKDKLMKLAEWDGGDWTQYAGFEDWYQSLGTKLERGQVRRLVRSHVRRLVQDERGEEFAFDLQEDNQLGRSIYEHLKKLGEDPVKFPEYAGFPARFDKAATAAKPGEEPKKAEGGSAIR